MNFSLFKSSQPLAAPNKQHLKSSIRDPLEIFVGNLSYFCDEKDLYQLFQDYSTVTNVRIMRGGEQQRPLLFGFVTVTSRQELLEMCLLLNGHLFLGRHLRVEPSDLSTNNNTKLRSDNQLHIAISSSFSTTQIIKPTEILLRKFFTRFGSVFDVQVNWYACNTTAMPCRQEGYAFITFYTHDHVDKILLQQPFLVDGITLICTIPKSNPAATQLAKSDLQPRQDNPTIEAQQYHAYPSIGMNQRISFQVPSMHDAVPTFHVSQISPRLSRHRTPSMSTSSSSSSYDERSVCVHDAFLNQPSNHLFNDRLANTTNYTNRDRFNESFSQYQRQFDW